MTVDNFHQLIKKGWYLPIGLWGLLSLGWLVAIMTHNTNNSRSIGFFWVCSVLNIAYYLKVHRRYAKNEWTIRWYFSVANGSALSLCFTVSLLVVFLVTEEILKGLIGWGSLIMLFVVVAHQFYRGTLMTRRQWHGPQDVIDGIISLRKVPFGLPGGYDFSFFAAVSILGSLIGKLAGDSVQILFGALLFSLSIPFLMGIVLASNFLIKEYFPVDQPYPR